MITKCDRANFWSRAVYPHAQEKGEANTKASTPGLDGGVAGVTVGEGEKKNSPERLFENLLNNSRHLRLGGGVGISNIDIHIIYLSTSCPRGQRTARLPQSDWLHQ